MVAIKHFQNIVLISKSKKPQLKVKSPKRSIFSLKQPFAPRAPFGKGGFSVNKEEF